MIDDIYVALCNASEPERERAMAFARGTGLNYEITGLVDPQVLDNAEERARQLAWYKHLFEDFRGKVSLSAPLADLNPVSEDPLIARASRGRYVQAVEMARQLGAKFLLVPSQYSPVIKAENRLNKWLGDMTRFWEQLLARTLDAGSGSNLVVLIHNTMGDTPEYVRTIVSRVDSPNLRAALSVGHANLFSTMSANDWVDEMGNWLSYVQVSNNDGQILAPQDFETGQIDLESFLNHLSLMTQPMAMSIQAQTVDAIETNHMLLAPFLKMQEENFTSKSFLV